MSQAEDYIEQTDRKIAEQAARIAELEAVLAKIVSTCDFCDDGFIEYQPSGIDGYLPTGDANIVTEPCFYCADARALLKGSS
jgi:hypothetical protein